MAEPPEQIQQGINAMQSGAGATVVILQQVVRELELMRRGMAANNKELDVYGSDMHSVMRDAADLQLSIKRIGQLQKTALGAGTSQKEAVKTIKAVTKEYEALLKAMNRTHGGETYTKEITANLKAYEKALKRVEAQSADTWDTKGLRACNTALEAMHSNVKDLSKGMQAFKTTKARDEFRALGATIDDAFHNRLTMGLRKIPGIGHAMQAMDMNRRFSGAQKGVGEYQKNRVLQRTEMANAIAQQRADKVRATFGAAGVKTLNAMGHQSGDPGSRNIRQMLGVPQIHAAAKGGQGGANQMEVGTLHVDTLVMSGKIKMLNPGPKASATALPGEPGASGLAGAALGEAGRRELFRQRRGNHLNEARATPEAITALLGSKNGKLVHADRLAQIMQGGSAVDMGASIAKTLLKGGPVVSAIIGVVQAGISMHDKVAESNKKIGEGLAGTGMFGGGGTAYDNLHAARKSLISTSFSQQMLYGQGFEKNLDLYKTLNEGGIGTGKSLTGGRLNLGDALSGGQGFHGAMMQNAVQTGTLSGFSQSESVKLTLKLIEKFGQTTDATKQFFVELNEFANTSGISAGRIVEMVDSITDQFTDLQKSLIGTVEALHKVGDAGIFMSKRVEGVVKDLTKPLEMSPSQRYYNVSQQMAGGGGAAMANALRNQNEGERNRLLGPTGVLGKYGLKPGASHEEIMAAIGSNTSVDGETRRADMEAYQQMHTKYANNEGAAHDWATGNVEGVVARGLNGGGSMAENLSGRMQLLKSQAQLGGISNRVFEAAKAGDPKAIAEVMGNLRVGLAGQQGTLGSGETAATIFQASGNAREAGAQTIMNTAFGVQGSAQGLMAQGGTPQQRAANRAKYGLLNQYGEQLNASGVITHQKNGDFADEFVEYMRNNKGSTVAMGKVEAALTHSATLTDEMIDHLGDLGKITQDQTDAEKQKTAKENSAALAINTTTSDMAMARAFEYLFTRVVSSVDKMADLLPDSSGLRDARKAFQGSYDTALAQIQGSVDPSTLTGGRLDAYNQFIGNASKVQDGQKDQMQALSDMNGALKNVILGHGANAPGEGDRQSVETPADTAARALKTQQDADALKLAASHRPVGASITAAAGESGYPAAVRPTALPVSKPTVVAVDNAVADAIANGQKGSVGANGLQPTGGVVVNNFNHTGVFQTPYPSGEASVPTTQAQKRHPGWKITDVGLGR
jgi:hypothetical protein